MISIKRVVSKGKRYAYIRGSDVALVRGFIGTEEQFESVLAAAIAMQDHPKRSEFDSFSRLRMAKALHSGALKRSQEAGRTYSLSADEIHEMLIESGDKCQLTELPFVYHRTSRRRPMAPSLDRIDNRLGYVRSNVRMVCTCVNMALNEWGTQNFEIVCRAFLRTLENKRASFGKQNIEKDKYFNNDNAISI